MNPYSNDPSASTRVSQSLANNNNNTTVSSQAAHICIPDRPSCTSLSSQSSDPIASQPHLHRQYQSQHAIARQQQRQQRGGGAVPCSVNATTTRSSSQSPSWTIGAPHKLDLMHVFHRPTWTCTECRVPSQQYPGFPLHNVHCRSERSCDNCPLSSDHTARIPRPPSSIMRQYQPPMPKTTDPCTRSTMPRPIAHAASLSHRLSHAPSP